MPVPNVPREGNLVVVSVQDYRMGIPKEVRGHVFERLYRGRDHTHEGMGLGLYVSKGIIEVHSGRIRLESEEGKGTIFYFTLAKVGRDREERRQGYGLA